MIIQKLLNKLLKNETVEEYKQAVRKDIRWLAFTSTSKDREAAEMFSGNTLFIISIPMHDVYNNSLTDIWSLSHYMTG
ncbi:unnamed protein product [Didymodactylos carnosus]|uniref:Uncharacterized protein n=1 Tax=Didymodactylos carnosus TaxID=1234261 RepID=A0A815LJ64_9BILA|nr:unnamed protein product [Didymodactylos carnosus]CAF4299472.1 unnamed protein product [Didymodactylos carnosus]